MAASACVPSACVPAAPGHTVVSMTCVALRLPTAVVMVFTDFLGPRLAGAELPERIPIRGHIKDYPEAECAFLVPS